MDHMANLAFGKHFFPIIRNLAQLESGKKKKKKKKRRQKPRALFVHKRLLGQLDSVLVDQFG